MLTFTQAQIDRFQTRWQIEQLLAQLPGVLAKLAERYPAFYAKSQQAQHRYHGRLRIEEAVLYGYTEIEQIQHLLDMEYQAQLKILEHNGFQPLYQANWLQPRDRIDGMQYRLALNGHQDRHGVSAYRLLDGYSTQQRCLDIAKQKAAAGTDQPASKSVQMLRQAFYHALLKDSLQASGGWQAWKSDWQQAQIGIEHPGYRRRIRCRPADHPDLQAELDDGEQIPLLTLYLPDQLIGQQHRQMNTLLAHWALDLHSITRIKEQISKDKLDTNQPGHLTGVSHA